MPSAAHQSLTERVEASLAADYPDLDHTVIEAAVRVASRRMDDRDVSTFRVSVESTARSLLKFAES